MPLYRLTLTFLLLAAAVISLAPKGVSAAIKQARCARFATPHGSDRAGGSARHPFRTAQRLANSLRPGEVGCLRGGVYRGDLGFRHGGRPSLPITLRSAPGERATIIGRVYMPKQADYVRLTFLSLDGRNSEDLPSPTVDSTGDEFLYDDVTNDHTAICYELGSAPPYGAAANTLIQHNHIHDCGTMPGNNHEHGIYVGNSVGARILGNVIYDNADRGIQLYWNAQQTVISGNIIDHNGQGIIISGAGGFASSNNRIVHNVITNSTSRADVGSYWPAGTRKGTGNVVAANCLYGRHGTIDHSAGGFVARNNVIVNPHYRRVRGDYVLSPRNPCAHVLDDASRAGIPVAGVFRRHPRQSGG